MHHAAEAGMRKRKCGQDLLPHVAALFIFICCCFSGFARTGTCIKAGTPIGTVGRTGKNAFPARSPTHLHLMLVPVKGSALLPFDYKDKMR